MTSYDPEARRDTPLALQLKARIAREGPLAVKDYMRACLLDPQHGYYRVRQVLGRSGDFVTAPEISQVFGELVGLWCAAAWQQMGRPHPFDLVEYGPGRGTLMADALRALRAVPDCLAAVRVRLVEVSPALQQSQRDTLRGLPQEISWHGSLRGELEPGPSILIANEVLDAQPVEQAIALDGAEGQRGITVGTGGRLEFCVMLPTGVPGRDDGGMVMERRALHDSVARDMAGLPLAAALFIDYGHLRSIGGDTLQAVREHRFEHPLCSPGEADLTCQVDFERFGRQCRDAGFAVDGPVTQAELLGALGILLRASRLMAANPALAHEIEAGVARLMSPTGMGTGFKAIGVRSPSLAPLPGLADVRG